MLFLGKFVCFSQKNDYLKCRISPVSIPLYRYIQQGREGTAEVSIPSRSVPGPLRVIALVCLAAPLFFLCFFF